jgi:hypothetical protein
MTGKLRPRFRSTLDQVTNLELVPKPPPPPPVGTPLCPRCNHPGDTTDAYCRACGMSMAKAPRYGIDGPADGVWIAPGAHGSLVYRALGWRTPILRVAVMLAIAIAAVLLVLHAIVVAGFFPILPSIPGSTDQWIGWIGRFEVELAVVIAVMFVVANWWTSRAYRNLAPMQVVGLRVRTWLARVAWLIPVLNIWLSKVVLDDLWRSTDESVGYRSAAWRKQPAPIASHVGWIGAICATLLVPLSVLTRPDDLAANANQFRPSMVMGLAGYAMLLLGLGVLLGLVTQISDRQQARVERLGTSPKLLPAAWRPRHVELETDPDDLDDPATALKHAASGGTPWGSY